MKGAEYLTAVSAREGPAASSFAVLALAALALACGPGSPELVRWPEAGPDELLIQHVDVMDVEAGRVDEDRDVLIAEGRIAAIGLEAFERKARAARGELLAPHIRRAGPVHTAPKGPSHRHDRAARAVVAALVSGAAGRPIEKPAGVARA